MRDKFINAISKRETNLIIGVGLLILIVIAMSGCQKKTAKEPITEPQNIETCFEPQMIKDVNWKPIFNGYDNLYFDSNDTMYIGGNKAGKYQIECDKISIVWATKPIYQNLFIMVKYVKNDTLQLNSAGLGVTKYYK